MPSVTMPLRRWCLPPSQSVSPVFSIESGNTIVRDQALIAHATQVDPTSFWFACPLEIQQKAWPTEDYELARSLVDSAQPEDDLFAGIRDEALSG